MAGFVGYRIYGGKTPPVGVEYDAVGSPVKPLPIGYLAVTVPFGDVAIVERVGEVAAVLPTVKRGE